MNPRFAIPSGHPATARQLVRSALSGMAPDVIETAELLTSELVTNAMVHGSGEATVAVEVDEGLVRVEVFDRDASLDLSPLDVDPSSVHGRGLAIVNALASTWGIEPRHDGKVVWFALESS